MRARLLRATLWLGALGLSGLLVAASGIVPIKASSGHWAITEWLLELAKRRSVALHALGIDTPALDAPSLVVKGAGHYAIGCADCHGSPELEAPPIARGMAPPPPYLAPRLARWKPAELFSIVKHGIKFTGMPAWPARGRDDEVWALVAFLRVLPELDAEAYRQLVGGEGRCAPCHGHDGLGRGMGAFPKLAGQRPQYLRKSLEAYAAAERHSGTMQPIAAKLDSVAIDEVADYYAGLPRGPALTAGSDRETERGEEIALHGIPEQDVPPCAKCHADGAVRRNPVYPRLDGQYAEYLALQLQLFRDDQRGGTAYAHVMQEIAARLTPEQAHAVALYYASLP